MKEKIKTNINDRTYTADVMCWARGQCTEQGWNINYSSILTTLIQQAGRWCENYASDLFLDWKSIDNKLLSGEEINEQFLFGFRQQGVDHAAYVQSRLKDDPFCQEYRALWVLDIATNKEDLVMTMQLGRIR